VHLDLQEPVTAVTGVKRWNRPTGIALQVVLPVHDGMMLSFLGTVKLRISPTASAKETRNSASADKPRDAFVQVQWRG